MRKIIVQGSAVLAGLSICLVAGAALAQDKFDVQQFNPAPSQHTNGLGVWTSDVSPDLTFEAGFLGHYSDDPLVLRSHTGRRLESIVGGQLTVDLIGSLSLFDRLEINLDIPVILLQSSDSLADSASTLSMDASEAGFGVGDIRLAPKLMLVNTDTEKSPGGVGLALVLDAYFPSGNDEYYQGGEFRFLPMLVLDGIWRQGHRFMLNVCYLFRSSSDIADLQVDSSLKWGAGLYWKIIKKFHLILPEARGSAVLTADQLDPEEFPTEIDVGLRILPIEQVAITAAAGSGLFQGFGAPDWRAMVGFSWRQIPDADRDGDGFLNKDDACPDDPEDFDQFEDTDGCPEPDNDKDQVLDVNDKCPLDPEDREGFEDEDGCPDPDNDQDKILDVDDQCPNDPEDYDQFEDENGCPDPDNDQDKILDVDDQCPNKPEDMNGVADEDGCPEVDTDGDGLLDPNDKCPKDPEDKDEFEDEDGCPDPDNDQDRILDVDDKCPLEPEVWNGYKDEDGCPDKALITVTCEKIEIHQKVYFKFNSDKIMSKSFKMLNQIAAVLASRADLKKIRVEGHTDSKGSDEYNLDLSKRRAASVLNYLVGKGVASERLVSEGYGESRPIASNDTSKGRAENRRVEFMIIEQEGCVDQQKQKQP
jgi:outer membrane protein OmpA-like peptidoglycan-associated protein